MTQLIIEITVLAITVGGIIWRISSISHKVDNHDEKIRNHSEDINNLENKHNSELIEIKMQMLEIIKIQTRLEERVNFIIEKLESWNKIIK